MDATKSNRVFKALLVAAMPLLASSVHGQVTGKILSFGVTNYSGYIIAGDTNSGGRQAIQTSTGMFFTNTSSTSETYDFELAYQLIDQTTGQAVPILDQNGLSNIFYYDYQTNTLPYTYFIGFPILHEVTVTSLDVTNAAPLQPLARLNPYHDYETTLTVYSRTNGPGIYFYTGQSDDEAGFTFYDFTNTASPDPSPNFLITAYASLESTFAISNSPAEGGYPVFAEAVVQRYDDFTLPPYPTNTTVALNFQLVNSATGVPVPLLSTQAVFNVSLESHTTNTPPDPTFAIVDTNFSLVPLTALDSVDNQYTVIMTQTHTEGTNVITDNTNIIGPQQLLYFNGELYFGPLLTYFTNVNTTPVITNTVAGSHLDVLLTITTNAGYFPGAPNHFYGNGSNIAVSLSTNGTATLLGGQTVTVQGPPTDIASISNVYFQRTGITMTSNGPVGTFTVGYPVGFTTSFPTNSYRWSVSAFVVANLPLNQNLTPASNVITYPFAVYGIQENLPIWFAVPAVQWVVNSGEFVMNPTSALFVRELEDNLLTANTSLLANTNAARRVSNDAFYRNVTVEPGSQLIVAADSNGIARVTCQLALNPPELRPHFPYSGDANGAQIQTASGGMLIISNGVITSKSFLPVNAPVPIEYERSCGDTNCSPQLGSPATLAFTPSNNQLGFTADGGLLAYGSVPPTNLTWGYDGGTHYAQEAYTIQDGAYEMAGTFLLGGQSTVDPTELSAALLFSGFSDGTNASYVERPGDTNYDSGFANYPGLNIRAPTTGNSYIAEQSTGPYPLDGRSKYYARYAGVSGIHESASFPSSLMLYGYDFTFTTYRLSFLDSDVDESRTDGSIAFPTQPAGFLQEFQDMKFSCTGDLESAEVPPDSGVKHMNYWNVNITPLSIQFQPSTNDLCGTGNRWLVLGVKTTLPFIPQELDASLGFQPSGNLVTPADGVEGTDSRFPVPGQLSLQGPGGDIYPLSTCAEGYFNNYTTSGAPPNGFYNLAGRLRVPFFDDIKVHLHVMPLGSNTAQISIMGGWPFAGTSAPDLGWTINNSNYFNEEVFDQTSDGFPTSAGITDYENSKNTMYRPVAQRNWIEVAIFDYPLQWNSVTREFSGFQDAPVDLPIIDVNSRLKEISPGKVDFDFDQDVTLQLPVIKSLDFLNDATSEIDGALGSVSNAVKSALGTAFTTAGFNELQSVLREDPTAFFQPVLNNALSGPVNEIFANLAAFPETNKQAFLSNAVYEVNHSTLTSALININGAAGQANTVIGQVDKTLTDAQNDVNVVVKVLGSSNAIGAIISQLTANQGPALGFVADIAGSELNSLVSGIQPTLNDLQSDFESLSNQLQEAHNSLTSASGDFNRALGQALGDTTGAQQFVQMAATDLSNRLASAITPAGDYFSADPNAAKMAIQQEIQNAFLSSQLPTDYQQTLRQFLFDNNAALDTLLDTFFDQIDGAIRDGLSDLITDSLDSTLQDVKGLASGSFLTAKIRGEPTFNGDSMTKIHLDAAVQVNVPQSMNFTAYMEILELDSMTTPMDCIPAGPPAAEVTVGANNVKLDWPGLNPTGTPLTLTVQAKWTLQDGNVIGLGGLFDIKGEVGFQGCSVNEIGADLAFGEEENYFAAKVAGTINILGVPVDVQGGVFVGKACSLQPILFIDPEATNVLSLNPNEFAGIYLEFGASLSLSQILFGESSCFLDIGVNESSAVYYDGGPSTEQIGMRQTMGIDASLLCLLSANASLTMFGTTTHSPSGYSLEIGGEAQICGSIGPCPFCISGCKGITVTGEVGTGGISYDVDY
ncbi:MAG TPA: hypothetical protein VH595_01340 [Verrucomicrobiae bacterium]|jgi:hypothetical protein|nr:hypothetical protein [Verrucomicrobiae bacterium]